MKYGLGEVVIEKICAVFSRFDAVEKVVLYGSRAQDTYRDGSDIDLTLFGANLTQNILGDIADALDDLLLPYEFDLSIYDELEHAKLRDHIERVGVEFYKRKNADPNSGDAVMWETESLGEVCENLDKMRVPITKSKREAGNIPYYGASGIVDYVKDYIFDGDYLLVSEGSPYLLMRTYPIAFSICGKNWVNNHAHILKFEHLITQKFIEYYLNSISLEAYVSGMAQPKLNQKSLNSIQVPSLPLEEQKRIVEILDEAFAGIDKAIENTEKNLTNARELFESYLNNILTQKDEGWVDTDIGKEADLLNGFAFKSKDYAVENDGIKLLRGDNIVQGQFRWNGVKYWPTNKVDGYKKFSLVEGDVILAMDRTWVKAGIKYSKITKTDLPCLLVQRVACLRTKPSLNSDYLYYLFGSKMFSEYVISIQTGLGVPHISGTQINNFKFSRPPLELQATILDEVDSLQGKSKRLEDTYQQKLTALKELKQSLLQKAFSGELTSDMREAA